jgi:hypothetical protein
MDRRGAGWPTVAGHTTTAVRLAPRRHFVELAVVAVAVVMARKKHSARSVRRVIKGDVAPLNAIRRDEIVDVIVENLRPGKNQNSRGTITAAVNYGIDVLLNVVPLQKEQLDPRPYRKHAKKLDKALGAVEELLASSPQTLARSLFNRRLRFFLDTSIILANPAAYSFEATKSIEERMREYQTRVDADYRTLVDAFVTELRRLRKVCAQDYGLHPNYDHAKNLSAEFAYDLMRQLSDQNITGTEDGAFRTISGLLYEVISGQQDVDLKRACDAVLASWAQIPF